MVHHTHSRERIEVGFAAEISPRTSRSMLAGTVSIETAGRGYPQLFQERLHKIEKFTGS